MIPDIVLFFLGIYGIYYTFRFFITYVTNKILLIFCINLTIFLQIHFVVHFFPHHTHFITEQQIV